MLTSMPSSFAADWQSAQALAASAPEPSAIALSGLIATISLSHRRRRLTCQI
jgi:hypothetical protein